MRGGSSGATCSLVRRRKNGRRPLREPRDVLVRVAAFRQLSSQIEHAAAAEQAGVEEIEQAVQLAEVILDRRAGEREPMIGAQQPHGLRRGRARVLDRLRLVEDDVVEMLIFAAPRRRGAACRTS